MRLIINLILVALAAFLVYVLVGSVSEPIKFEQEKNKRERQVVDKLITIRKAQEAYRGITGKFAPTFDSLALVLKTGEFKIVSASGDPDDPDNPDAVIYDTTTIQAKDSIASMGINVDSLKYIPFGGGKTFKIAADTLTFQKTLVNVVEVGANRKDYLGQWADPTYRKYDNTFDPNKTIKFGDMTKPTVAGNWESN